MYIYIYIYIYISTCFIYEESPHLGGTRGAWGGTRGPVGRDNDKQRGFIVAQCLDNTDEPRN